MDDPSVVAERGVLTAPAEVWQLAVRRAEVIGLLAGGDAVGHAAADTAAAELGISGVSQGTGKRGNRMILT